MTKIPGQKFKYFEKENSFSDEIKTIFHPFKRALLKQIKYFFWKVKSDSNITILTMGDPCCKSYNLMIKIYDT